MESEPLSPFVNIEQGIRSHDEEKSRIIAVLRTQLSQGFAGIVMTSGILLQILDHKVFIMVIVKSRGQHIATIRIGYVDAVLICGGGVGDKEKAVQSEPLLGFVGKGKMIIVYGIEGASEDPYSLSTGHGYK